MVSCKCRSTCSDRLLEKLRQQTLPDFSFETTPTHTDVYIVEIGELLLNCTSFTLHQSTTDTCTFGKHEDLINRSCHRWHYHCTKSLLQRHSSSPRSTQGIVRCTVLLLQQVSCQNANIHGHIDWHHHNCNSKRCDCDVDYDHHCDLHDHHTST